MLDYDSMRIPALTFDDVQIRPNYNTVKSRSDVNLQTKFTKNYKIGIPLIASPMDTVCEVDMARALYDVGGVGIIHRFNDVEDQVDMVKQLASHIQWGDDVISDYQDDVIVDDVICAAVGATGDYYERADALVKAGANVLLIDVAHGHTKVVGDAIKTLKNYFSLGDVDIIAGNVATAEGAKYLIDCGADAIRVGVGGGSVCETRVRTGVGIPQLSSVHEARNCIMTRFYETDSYQSTPCPTDIPIISCGGVKSPGDVAKAIAAGASSVIIGSLFAGTTESPGEFFITGAWPNRKHSKLFRGAASDTTKLKLAGNTQYTEGNATMVPSKGSVKNVINDVLDGLRSAMTYVGAETIPEFYENATFVRVTDAGIIEASPHLL